MIELQIPTLPNAFRGQVARSALYLNGSIPVIRLPSGVDLKDARRRFSSDAQSMLIEGYTKVEIIDHLLQETY
jgi:hypothetical protein